MHPMKNVYGPISSDTSEQIVTVGVQNAVAF